MGLGRIWVWQEERAEDFFAEARRLLCSGGVLALPTETYYALAVNPFDEAALARLFALKERPAAKPVLVLDQRPGDAYLRWPGKCRRRPPG